MSERYEALCEGARPLRQARDHPAKPLLRLDLTTSSVAAGADLLLADLRALVARRGIDCTLLTTGTFGLSFALPTIDLHKPGRAPVLYGPLPPAQLDQFITEVVEGDDPGARWAIGVRGPQPQEGIPPLADHPFWRGQVRRVMEWMGVIDPEEIDEALAVGAYAGLDRALTMEPLAVCDLVERSGLGGRGGGGFPAGRKWKFLLGGKAAQKYLVCNSDEGDPGAFVNRVLMESDPHALIEGLAIAGHATGAGHGFLYIRDEYPLSVVRMRRALEQARARGLLGTGILGSATTFDLTIVRGAGSYVCGEETGLIASVEGLRGMPKIRPPFPAQRGVFGLPSNVNNAETYANVPLILRQGDDWYRQYGTEGDRGTKMFSISGHLQRPGVLEVPFGLPMSALLLEAGGAPLPGRTLKGIQPGGPLGGVLPASDIHLPLDRKPFTERGVLLGSGGLIIFDDRACALDLALYFSQFCEEESCGRCTTCHGGSQRLVEILQRIGRGGGTESDLERIGALDRTLQNANCLHGQFTPYAVRSLLRYFQDEITAHVRDRRCPARACRGLIRHRVLLPLDPALAEAAGLCPTDAILPDGAGGYRLDDALCIQCGLCREQAPQAVALEDRFSPVAISR